MTTANSPSTPKPGSNTSTAPYAALGTPSTPTPSAALRVWSSSSTSSAASTPSVRSSAASSTTGVSDSDSASVRRAAIELSLPTQRRLIRKPLPDLPGSRVASGESDASSSAARTASGAHASTAPGALALAWKPDALPEPEPETEQDDAEAQGKGLDAQSLAHLQLLLAHLTVTPAGASPIDVATIKSHSAVSDTTEGATTLRGTHNATHAFDEDMSEALLSVVEEACVTLSKPQTLEALQRTAAMRWRAEATLRAPAGAPTGATQHPSRWARLGWPGLVGGGGGSGSAISSSTAASTASEAGLTVEELESLDGSIRSSEAGEARVRKRDVAVKMLANAVWLARAYAPLSPSPANAASESRAAAAAAAAAEPEAHPTPVKPRGRTGAPSLLRQPTATTALSAPASAAASEASSPTTAPTTGETSVAPSAPGTPQLETGPLPLLDSGTQSSKARDHLASLSAAAGASLAAAAARGDSSLRSGSTSRGPSRRPSVASLRTDAAAAGQSEAARAETEALERADREWRACVGTKCEAAARVCVASVRVKVQTGRSTSGGGTLKANRTRSGTLMASSANATGEEEEEDARLVAWQPGVFEGNELMQDGLKVPKGNDDEAAESRLARVGGTFVVRAKDDEEAKIASRVLEVLLYAGTSMLLEAELLASVGAARAQPPAALPRSSSLSSSTRTRCLSEAATLTSANTSPTGTVHAAPRTPRRWGRGLWGMGEAVSNALRGHHNAQSIDATLPPRTHRSSLSSLRMERSSTDEPTELAAHKRSSIGFPRSKTRDDVSSGGGSTRSRLDSTFGVARIGRMITSSLGRHGAEEDEDALDEEESQSETPRPRAPSLPSKVSAALPRTTATGPPPLTASPELAALWSVGAEGMEQLKMSGETFARAFNKAQSLAFLVEGTPGIVAFAAGSNDVTQPGGKNTLAPPTSSGGSVGATSSSPSASASAGTVRSTSELFAREEVRFYARAGRSRDVPLGQLIEEMCSRVNASSALVEQVRNRTLTARLSSGSAVSAASNAATVANVETEHAIKYTHGRHRVTVTAQRLPREAVETAAANAAEAGGEEPEELTAEAVAEEENDVAAVAAALHTNAEAARLAVVAAEHAVTAAEGRTPVAATSVNDKLGIWMWSVDAKTGKQSRAKLIPQAVFLGSFARFLEAVLYHPSLQSSPSSDVKDRYDVVRAFRTGRSLVKVCVEPIKLYQLAIQGSVTFTATGDAEHAACDTKERKLIDDTRLDIQKFFASVKSQITALEQVFVARELDDKGRTIKPKSISKAAVLDDAASMTSSTDTDMTDASSAVGPLAGPLTLLNKMRKSLTAHEFELYDALKQTPVSILNDVRKAFNDRSKSAKNRLAAWAHKHLTKSELHTLGRFEYAEPEYAKVGVHTFPGSQYVVREDEPLSIIAFSLSSRDYRAELSSHLPVSTVEHDQRVLNWRTSVMPGTSGSQISSNSGAALSLSSVALSAAETKRSSMASGPPDPDRDEDFHDAEPVRVHMKRKKRGREASILSLTLRRVGSTISSHHSEAHTASTEHPPGGDEGDDEDAAIVSALGVSALSPNIFDRDQTPPASRVVSGSSSQFKSSTISSAATNSTFRAHITQVSGRPASLASLFSKDTTEQADTSFATETGSIASSAQAPQDLSLTPSSLNTIWNLGSSGFRPRKSGEPGRAPSEGGQSLMPGTPMSETPPILPASSNASNAGDAPSTPVTPRLSTPAEAVVSPHVKHNLFHGNTKVSIVSFYAEEFAALRQRFGVAEEGFAESLSRSALWNATGGKSKSAFYKTKDGAWVAKQLLTVWSIDEKEAFLEFAPAYLKYMMNAAVNDCPTLLVKIAGVYSLKVKDVRSGDTRLKMNVMLLENLWTGKETARFDLKGIRDRRVKPGAAPPSADDGPSVCWDAEWIEQYKAKAYVPEAQKAIFQRAIANDLHFLQQMQIMDYSLLLGLTEPSANEAAGKSEAAAPVLQARIVDIIGAWTLAKSLESSSKRALKSGVDKANVTILPPKEYAERFSKAMESYFIGIPQRPEREELLAAASARSQTREPLPSVL